MQIWDEMVKAALVGTDRYPVAFDSSDQTAGPLLAQLDASQADAALLQAAALLAPVRRAGYLPTVAADASATAVRPESRPYISDRAAQDIAALAAHADGQKLLSEWLDAVALQARIVPPEYLPQLLALGARSTELRGKIRVVMGRRGRWLANQNPAWRYMAELFGAEMELTDDAAREEAGRLWQTGNIEVRERLLESVRRQDPDFGRHLLETTWWQDSASERARLLACLEIGLSPADEPLLESALDAVSKTVRPAARRLLDRLPESRLVGRMIARAESLIKIEQRQVTAGLAGLVRADAQSAGRYRIMAQAPADFDDSMARDQIERTDPSRCLKDPLHWLSQIVGTIPLRYWTETWSLSPPEIVSAECAPEFRFALVAGWIHALTPEDAPDWAQSLFFAGMHEFPAEPAFQLRSWSRVLPHTVLEQGILYLLSTRNDEFFRGVVFQAGALPTWSVPLSRAFLQFLASSSDYGDAVKVVTGMAASRMPDSLLEDLWAEWTDAALRADERYAESRLREMNRAREFELLRRSINKRLNEE